MLGDPQSALEKTANFPGRLLPLLYLGSLGEFLALTKLPSLMLMLTGGRGCVCVSPPRPANSQSKARGSQCGLCNLSHVLELNLRVASCELGDFL